MSRLAIDGGHPVRTAPLPPWPYFDDEDLAAVREVLVSGRVNYWTGEEGLRFEDELAAATGTTHAVALANGTVALEIALRALGIGPGDDVVVPAATFIATASAVVACGARPVVVDLDEHSRCLTAATVEPALTDRTRAIVAVHLGGHPADLEPLLALATRHDLRVVEDCAQAHGARVAGRPVGSIGDIAAWSFCQDKIMTTAGEGGAVTTRDARLWRRCWELKEHGKNWAAVRGRDHGTGFRWVHDGFGTNARMTEVQAAVGRGHLRRLDSWVTGRRANAGVLAAALRDQPAVRLPCPPLGAEHAYYRFHLSVRPELLAPGWDRDRIVAAVAAEGVPCSTGGCHEIHRERAFASVAGAPAAGELPVAAELGRTSLALLVHPTLRPDDLADTAEAVTRVLREAT
jgi:dTDP-4-amino-4,6-dideoxygalactose transaminase